MPICILGFMYNNPDRALSSSSQWNYNRIDGWNGRLLRGGRDYRRSLSMSEPSGFFLYSLTMDLVKECRMLSPLTLFVGGGVTANVGAVATTPSHVVEMSNDSQWTEKKGPVTRPYLAVAPGPLVHSGRVPHQSLRFVSSPLHRGTACTGSSQFSVVLGWPCR